MILQILPPLSSAFLTYQLSSFTLRLMNATSIWDFQKTSATLKLVSPSYLPLLRELVITNHKFSFLCSCLSYAQVGHMIDSILFLTLQVSLSVFLVKRGQGACCEVCNYHCKGVHSLMPDLGHVVDSDGLVCLHSGFHQRYEQTR